MSPNAPGGPARITSYNVCYTKLLRHIIRAEELRPAGAVPESEAAPSIREHLRTLKGQQALKDRIAELRAKAKIEILLEN